MSQLRKSASFRSRIPVRRSKLPLRRCCSPHLLTSSSAACIGGKSIRNSNQNNSNETSHNTNQYHQHHHHQHQNNRNNQSSNNNISNSHNQWAERRYSSSSYSSSDESHESEAPLQRLIQQSTSQGISQMITVSTDAMSLDGLLDSVSSGSFSDTPSSPSNTDVPVNLFNIRQANPSLKMTIHSSYESLDKLNYNIETLKLTNTNKNHLNNNTHHHHQHIYVNENRNLRIYDENDPDGDGDGNDVIVDGNDDDDNVNNIDTQIKMKKYNFHRNIMNPIQKSSSTAHTFGMMMGLGVANNNNNNHNDNEWEDDLEKQKQLSDWYYIKSSPKPKETIKCNTNNSFVGLHPNTKKLGESINKLQNNQNLYQNDVGGGTDSSNQTIFEAIETSTSIPVHYENCTNPSGESSFQKKRQLFNNLIRQNTSIIDNRGFNIGGVNSAANYNSGGRELASTRFGEISSSSFEHVNMITNYNIKKDKMYVLNTSNSSSNMIKYNLSSDEIKYNMAKTRPLPRVPDDPCNELYPPKNTSTPSYRTECELSGSYVSLECPSPPGPPACLSEPSRDPQSRLARCLRTLYTELALREPIIPPWTQPVAPGATCPAKLEPELRLHVQSHGFNECISVDQLLTPIQTKEGPFLEAPRRLLIECPPWATRSSLALRILHAWAKEPPWPARGTPVAIALFLPVQELKGTLSNYVAKELLPKGPLNPFSSGFGGFNAAWSSLDSLKAKLLIVIDGYDIQRAHSTKNRKGKATPQEILDLLEGRVFPEARIVVISVTQNCTDLLPLMQRHVTYEGLTWGRSASLLGGGQWGAPTRLLDTVQECMHLRNMARTPLGCLALASIYESTAGDMPTDEIDVIEAVINCVAADPCQSNITELGRLALFCLKAKRPAVTSSEIRMYCSSTDAPILGCLDKAYLFGKSAKRKAEYHFNPICPGVAEFLAANYLSSLVNRPGLLAAEIAGFPMGDDIEPDMLKVLSFAMSLLGNRAHVLLSKLTTLWLSPQTIFTLALAGGDSEANLNALCDLLGISKLPPISPLELKPIWVQIKSAPNELHGWGLALKGPTCTLKNLELVYQLEKNMLLDSRNSMDIFLDSLSRNESVTNLRISSLIENDIRESDINHLAMCVTKALLKPRLECFELILTLLEEDPPILKLQSVVTALCRSIPRQPKLTSLLLDLGLCTSQLVQICTMLEKCPLITRLSLPHLRCERGAIGALASLLTARPLASLALSACWGARDDPPSSSGVSMGSGSGSSSGTSGLIKQSSLTGAPSPRSYPPGLFSSLPRGILAPSSTMGRSATLPRQPMEPPPDKRSSDSVVSRTWYPTPACDGGPHNSGTLHDLLLSARESYSKLHSLDLSKAQLSLEDSMCLGETVRLSTSLHSLKLEGASRLSEILPAIIGAGESSCLQMISLGSPRLAMEDGAITMTARSLSGCPTLRLLSIEGWSFRLENPTTLSAVRAFLTFTSARELALSNCRLHLPTLKNDIVMPPNAYECRSVVVLKMAGAQVLLADHVPLKGPQLLPFLNGFPCLRELDLSAPARSGLGSSTSAPLILGDKCIISFFQNLHLQFSMLNTLKICNWIIHLDDSVKTLKTVSKSLRNSTLSHIKTDGISVLDRPRKMRSESQFLHTLLAAIPSLRWMGMSLAGMNEHQITAIGNAVLDFKGHEIDIRLSDSTIENARVMTQSLGLDGKFDIKVSTFGTSSGILIHVEKSGVKSLTRKKY